jgi:hypothetical protein
VVPNLHFYDGQFHLIGSVTAMDMWHRNELWRVGVQGSVALPRKARYIVLVAGDGDAGYGPMVQAPNGLSCVPASALGDLSIRLVSSAGPGKSD